MTTPRKPAAAKPAAKRTRKPATPKVAPAPVKHEEEHVPLPLPPQEERQAKLEAYAALKRANVAIPEGLAAEVEGWIAEEQERRAQVEAQQKEERKSVEEANANGPWYVLNGYPGPFSLRLERQDKKKRIELKPLGQRGDMHPLLEEDLQDPILIENLRIGLISIIPAGEAQLRSERQVTNIRQPHTPLSILRNERGETYAPGSIKVEAEFNSQGVTVAYLDPEVAQGRKQVPKQNPLGDLMRPQWTDGQNPYAQQAPPTAQQVSHFVPTGGNPAIISSGFPDNAKAKIADDIARRRGGEGPQAGLPQGVTVSVAPVQKS